MLCDYLQLNRFTTTNKNIMVYIFKHG